MSTLGEIGTLSLQVVRSQIRMRNARGMMQIRIPSNYEYLMGTRLRECCLELRKDVNYSTIHMLLRSCSSSASPEGPAR